jgi:hypothetical protein
MDKERDTYRNFMGKPDRKSTLGRSLRGRECNTEMDLLAVE